MKKTLIAAVAVGLLASVRPAAADPLTSWIMGLFGMGVNDGAQPNDGPGSGTGIAD